MFIIRKNEIDERNILKCDEINYKILNPGGNKTGIVIGNNYSMNERKLINDYILKKDKDVEQVGFISRKEKKLEMAGGEFCANATRCAIWEYLQGEESEINIEVSGCKEKVIGGINNDKEVYVNLEINKNISDILDKDNIYNFVKLDGIFFAIINEENSEKYIAELKENEEKTKNKFRKIMNEFQVEESAVGIILLEKQGNELKINPIIWVKSIDTLYYETACGSGSIATAIYKKYICNQDVSNIVQPSGKILKIKLEQEKEKIKKVTLIGKVEEEE